MEETIMDRYLILEDGTLYPGIGFGHDADCVGELVFTTGMTGYQESITDQSYNGQIITFTYPLIGNTGINRDDNESISPSCKAIVVKEYARVPSNFRSVQDIDSFLIDKKIVGISGIDTRALVRKLRDKGTIKASIVKSDVMLKKTLRTLRNNITNQ
jgi:carbamoyl-phosphate synthase small subunit